ncbi:MAG TPA: hypothetical protein VEH80_00015 [Candidatus Bathyarchaeia archaeon]|nr:hypothetical protein [Candidatus Bathyarchaeia archaeon]
MSAERRGLAHLIGSVPLPTTDDVFRRIAGALGPVLTRLPDGETGERRRWIYWQRTMLQRHPAMEVDAEAGLLELRQWDGSLLRRTDLLRFRRGVDPAAVDFPLGYADAAADSWALFERLRREGVLADGLRFQVCLPTPMSSAFMYVSPRAHDDYLAAYERALLRDLRRVVATVPPGDLSIQWDICQEVLLFEGYFPSRPADYRERVFALLERLGDAVPAAVDMGYHLCYGSPADQHLVMPKDTAVLAEIGRVILARVHRPVSFLHLPVPRERDDHAYFEPLGGLHLPAAVQLYLGLIHHDDRDGDRRRIDAAGAVVGRGFGVATECGWGRGEPARLDGLLDSHLRAVDYLARA